MKTLIIYASRHGSSEKASKLLKEKLVGNIEIHNIKNKKLPNLNNFDSIIIGGSIHMGVIQNSIKNFCIKNTEQLTKKYLGIFLCCMDKEKAQIQFENAYPDDMRNKAFATSLFGGEFKLDKMSWFERSIVKKVVGVTKNVSDIDIGAIDRFAEKFNLLPN